jgi:aldehyde dehydrogenase (NAD+)
VITKEHLFIGGEWVTPESAQTVDVVSPVTEDVMARVPSGSASDVDRAVAGARAAVAPPHA